MAPKTRKAVAAAHVSADIRKKQKVSSESVESLSTGSETVLISIAVLGERCQLLMERALLALALA